MLKISVMESKLTLRFRQKSTRVLQKKIGTHQICKAEAEMLKQYNGYTRSLKYLHYDGKGVNLLSRKIIKPLLDSFLRDEGWKTVIKKEKK